MEDWDVQTLCANDGETAIRITEYQNGIRLCGNHRLVGPVDNIPHRSTKVIADRIQIQLRIGKPQILEEHTVQIVIIILARMPQLGIKVLSALCDYRCKADYLRPRADDYCQFDFSVFFPLRIIHYFYSYPTHNFIRSL